jgi:GAF domain-containing protein
MILENLKPQLTAIIKGKTATLDQRLQNICKLLTQHVSYYDWVGFYFANHATKTLHLKAYCGAPTEHTVIEFGKGICGQVAVSNQNFVVPDVKAQDNYIACSISVKA